MPRILGIETSCDETAAAVVEDGRRVLANVVLSQVPVHRLYGGVVPELASREHLRGIVPVVRQALEQAGPLRWADLDAIAVTCGPGLAGALLVGLTYAKALALAARLPLLGIHHLEGHLHAVLLEQRRNDRPDPPLPAVALVVSGGHTQLYRVERPNGVFTYRLLGQTRDDAAGEAYDKVAKLLALGYPGGPLLDRLAGLGDAGAVAFGRIRLKGNPLDFSFSGLKTAVLRHVQTHPGLQAGIADRRAAIAALGRAPTLDDWRAHCDQPTLDLIASFQAAVVADLTQRALAAVDDAADAAPIASLWVTGGVAANSALRRSLQAQAERQGLELFAPALALCTDNAAMIATAAFPHFERQEWADASLAAAAQLPLGMNIAS
ncbi:MAG TPA: tRNA (adenosine(37)-N6)-threonylcarbamoyltransferase complex transferase subunit TsaD [Terriglobales bacterium]|nr:tRNA (adenosine(37)-N6)-threonylcarbamoyltransferase complex transferase subunit TsaD [Terriglobales bacterium]